MAYERTQTFKIMKKHTEVNCSGIIRNWRIDEIWTHLIESL